MEGSGREVRPNCWVRSCATFCRTRPTSKPVVLNVIYATGVVKENRHDTIRSVYVCCCMCVLRTAHFHAIQTYFDHRSFRRSATVFKEPRPTLLPAVHLISSGSHTPVYLFGVPRLRCSVLLFILPRICITKLIRRGHTGGGKPCCFVGIARPARGAVLQHGPLVLP